MAEIDLHETSSQAFEVIVLESVEEVFSCLGKNCKQAIYHYLESKCAIPRNEIPHRAQEFSEALQNLLGPGAGLIEIEIMKKLSCRVPGFKIFPRKSNISLENYLSSLSSFL
jgi:hypothetical protein